MAYESKVKGSMKMDTNFIEVLEYTESNGLNHTNDFGFGIWKKSATPSSYTQNNALWFCGLHVGMGGNTMSINDKSHSNYNNFWNGITSYGDHTNIEGKTTGINSLTKGLGVRLSTEKLEEILSGMKDDDEVVIGFFTPITSADMFDDDGLYHLSDANMQVKVDGRLYTGDLNDQGTGLTDNKSGLVGKTLKVKDLLGSDQFAKIKIGDRAL